MATAGSAHGARPTLFRKDSDMRLSDTMAKALSDQVTLELTASMVYLQLAIELEDQDLNGMGAWMRAQSEEELVHAHKFIAHCIDRDSAPQIGTISVSDLSGKKPIDLFRAALAHEQKVSESIRELYRLAQAETDLDVIPLLNWFVDEQVEEESTVDEIISHLALVGEDGSGILRIDSELGSRTPEIAADSE